MASLFAPPSHAYTARLPLPPRVLTRPPCNCCRIFCLFRSFDADHRIGSVILRGSLLAKLGSDTAASAAKEAFEQAAAQAVRVLVPVSQQAAHTCR